MTVWQIARVLVLLLAAVGARDVYAGDPGGVKPGQSIYLQGMLGSGGVLVGIRGDGNVAARGTDAACVNCHQRSGLGSTEGLLSIPPITPQFLFRTRDSSEQPNSLPYISTARTNRTPYTDATLARAIREGIDPDGKSLNNLMPRFAIDDAEMAALIGYLKSIDAQRSPGVGDAVLHFATIITPDADPIKRKGFLDVMQQYFAEKNSFRFGPQVQMKTSDKTLYSKSMFMVNRRWQLHVWELTGPADTWRAQLDNYLAREPVFAVVSGLGGSNWAPVHHFCEESALPCLFPNVEVPVDASEDFYPVYFSKGVLLEAELIAKQMAEPGSGPRTRTVQQIYRAGDSGEAGARALAETLEPLGIEVHSQVLPRGPLGQGLKEPLHRAGSADAVVLWLRPDDVAALGPPPPGPSAYFMSGLMGGLELSPLSAGWRERTTMAYPFDLPDRRVVRVDYPMGWFAIRHIPVVAPQVQADTYLACGLLAETLSHLSENFVRPYLVERVQQSIAHRIITGYYPRLTLGTRQRFASKGGYLVRFASPTGMAVVAKTEWTVPWSAPGGTARVTENLAPSGTRTSRGL